MEAATIKPRSEKLFVGGALLAYVLLVFFVTFHHEPWGDEGDAWLAARDMTLWQLFHWSHYAVTPLLWYLMLMPLAKAGLPYFAMHLLHAAIAAASAAVVLASAPFSRWTRLAISFSYLMSYEYAVVARNYAPLVLLTFLAAVCYRQRFQWPIRLGSLLALLCSTSMHGLCIAGGLGVAWGIDALRRKQFATRIAVGGLVAVLGGIVALAQVLPAPADRQIVPHDRSAIQQIGISIQRAAFPLLPADLSKTRPGLTGTIVILQIIAFLAIAITGLAALFYSLRRQVPLLLGAAFALISLEYVFVFGWYGGDRHGGMIWILFLVFCWIARRESAAWRLPRLTPVLVALALGCELLVAGWFEYNDWRYAHSGSTETAHFLASYLRADDTVVADSQRANDDLLPYLPGRSFWNPSRGQFATYRSWDQNDYRPIDLPPAVALAEVQKSMIIDPHFVFICQDPLVNSETNRLKLVFHNTRRQFFHADERFFIYRGLNGAEADRLEFPH